MEYSKINYTDLSIEIACSSFGNHHHLMIQSTDNHNNFEGQLVNAHNALSRYRREHLPESRGVFRRYFLSDASNQVQMLRANLVRGEEKCAVSIVQQPPLNGTKISLWAYLIDNATVHKSEDYSSIEIEYAGHRHYWTATNHSSQGTSEDQTHHLLDDYERTLSQEGMTIAENCVRTWFFVRDVDVNYGGVVVGRRDNFETVGLTNETHYIASTGIEGKYADYNVKVLFDAYAVKDLKPEQIQYLYAPDHLNPTYEYGVTFERGVRVAFTDHSQIYISGTASIDNKGNVVHVGDIERQTHRMLENVQALLAEATATFNDIAQIIVYLRDTADYQKVKAIFEQKFPTVPKIIVLAPVCRPSWLIEMECIAIK